MRVWIPLAAALLCLASTARADFMSVLDPAVSSNQYLYLNKGDYTSTITGSVGTQSGGPVINITTDAEVDVAASGWATIQNVNTNDVLTHLTFTPDDKNQFVDFSTRGQLYAPKDGTPGFTTGDITIQVNDQLGNTFTFTVKANGDFTRVGVLAVPGTGQTIKSIDLYSYNLLTDSSNANGQYFNQVKQVAFSTAADHVVPEPGTFGVALLGIGGLTWYARKRRT